MEVEEEEEVVFGLPTFENEGESEENALKMKSFDSYYQPGSGLTLSSVAYVNHTLSFIAPTDPVLGFLHTVMWGLSGAQQSRKKQVLAFSGFPAGTNLDDKVESIVSKRRWNNDILKNALAIMGLPKNGTRLALAQRLVQYLDRPDFLRDVPRSHAPPRFRKRGQIGHKAKKASKPVKFISAYMFFTRQERKRIAMEHPDWNFSEIGKELGRRWKDLDDGARAEFVTQERDSRQYVQEAFAAQGSAPAGLTLRSGSQYFSSDSPAMPVAPAPPVAIDRDIATAAAAAAAAAVVAAAMPPSMHTSSNNSSGGTGVIRISHDAEGTATSATLLVGDGLAYRV